MGVWVHTRGHVCVCVCVCVYMSYTYFYIYNFFNVLYCSYGPVILIKTSRGEVFPRHYTWVVFNPDFLLVPPESSQQWPEQWNQSLPGWGLRILIF